MKQIFAAVKNNRSVAVLIENGRTVSFVEESDNLEDRFRVGNIFCGRVKKIMHGLKSAFVELGGRDGFLFMEDGFPVPQVGQSFPVQITHAATGKKSAKVTRNLSVATRTLLLLPERKNYIGVSRKIAADDAEKLKAIAREICPSDCGIVLRTAAPDADRELLAADMTTAKKIYGNILAKCAAAKRPTLLFDGGNLATRIARDSLTDDIDAVFTDDGNIFDALKNASDIFAPSLSTRIYFSETSLIESVNFTKIKEEVAAREISLPSGGGIVIDVTEALTAIDVNSGSFSGSNMAETIERTNFEAAAEIMRQLRLKNIGGIVVVDFIDMKDSFLREDLLRQMRTLALNDRGRTTVVDITPLGLVEITRQKSLTL